MHQQHADRAVIEQQNAQRQRYVAVVVQPGGHHKSPAFTIRFQPGGSDCQPGRRHAGQHRDHAHQRWQEQVPWPLQGRVAQYRFENEGGQEQIHAQAQETPVRLLGEPLDAAQTESHRHQSKDWKDGGEQGQQCIHDGN